MSNLNLNEYLIYIDDITLYKCLKEDLGFDLLFKFIKCIFKDNVYKNSRNTRIFISNEDELDVIVEISDNGYITIEHSEIVISSINDYIKNLPSIIRDIKINNIFN